MRHAADGRVARRPAEGRVVEIQRVDVDGEHRDAAVLALRNRPVPLQQLLQVGQREQSGQAVIANGDPGRLMRTAQRIARQPRIDAQSVARVAMVSRISESPGRRRRAAAAASSRSKTTIRPCGNFAAARGTTRPTPWPRAAGGGHPVHGHRPAAGAGCGPAVRPRLAGQGFEAGIDVHDRLIGLAHRPAPHPRGRSRAVGDTDRHQGSSSAPRSRPAEARPYRSAILATVSANGRSPPAPLRRRLAARPHAHQACLRGGGRNIRIEGRNTLCTACRSLQIGSTSQPAAIASRARPTTSPNAAAPAMLKSSANTHP